MLLYYRFTTDVIYGGKDFVVIKIQECTFATVNKKYKTIDKYFSLCKLGLYTAVLWFQTKK